MTEYTDPMENAPQHAASAPEAADSGTVADGIPGADDTAAKKARREAANLRQRLKDAEARIEAMSTQLAAYDKAEAMRVLDDVGFANPEDAFLAGLDLDALRREDGALDTDAVRAKGKEILSARLHWQKRRLPDLDQGARQSVRTSKPGWGALFD
ncbi:hypothetical protein QWJ26_04145 [Streptomyces sp. CSDS2]|uniref:hypothetical protein n=1 Tax=Streptomyces sp. CSDS2 TaxID=3055051 RepID=UPI0025AFAA2B|nr:hypothetical protein [Streptomyces sp. CSDS2]MDN3259008.1 hypothetical protein [Streptomyces sp. CSDS2]